MISMWSRPRKPQRKPKPSASELSGSKTKAPSFMLSLASASRRSSYWAESVGKMPAKTIGFTSLKPGSGSVAGWTESVTVSPILVSTTLLMLAARKPTSPGPSSVSGERVRREDAHLGELVVAARWP